MPTFWHTCHSLFLLLLPFLVPLEYLLKTIEYVGRHLSNKYNTKRNYIIHIMCMIHIIQQWHKLLHSRMLLLVMIIQLHIKYWHFIFLCIRSVDLLYIMLWMLSGIAPVLFQWSLGFVPWIMQKICKSQGPKNILQLSTISETNCKHYS